MIEQLQIVRRRSNRSTRRTWRPFRSERLRSWWHRYGTALGLFILLGLIALFADHERAQLPALRRALKRADWRWLLIAVLAELAVLFVTVRTYRTVLRRVGHRLAWWHLVSIYLRSVGAGTVSPLGAAGSIVGMRSLAERGVPGDDAVLAWSLADLTAYASSLMVLLPTVALLALKDRLPDTVLIAVGLLVLLLATAVGLLDLLLGGDGAPPWLARRLPRRVAGFADRARAHNLRVRDLLPALGWSVLGELGTIAVLRHRSVPSLLAVSRGRRR
jgi:uncharacterized membrane protein YbhN (UPF0104 family)